MKRYNDECHCEWSLLQSISHLDELPDITEADPATEADLNNGAIRVVDYIFSFFATKTKTKNFDLFPH